MRDTLHTTMGAKGRVVIPAQLRAQNNMTEGTQLLFLDNDDGGLIIMTREQLERKVRKSLEGPSLVDELIAERRLAAKKEAEETWG